MQIRKAMVASVAATGMALGTVAVVTPPAQAATQIHGVWQKKKACKKAQWKSKKKHPSWWFSGCYWDNPNGMVGYWYRTKH